MNKERPGLGPSANTNSYLLTSEDLTIRIEEGITAFEGLFLSTEPPTDIADHYEFFVEADVDVVAGVGIRYFWSMAATTGYLPPSLPAKNLVRIAETENAW